MSSIRARAEEYLAMRRALGFQLTSFEPKLLSFVGYLETHDLDVVTLDAALTWATATPRSRDEVHWSRRLMVVRSFARHLVVLDPSTEVPPPDLLPHHYRRVTPYLFNDDEIGRLMHAADGLHPPLRALTWRTVLGLLTVTGLRVSEACGLDRADVDLDGLLLRVRNTKFGKHRLVPISPSTAEALRGYAVVRDTAFTEPVPAWFLNTRGRRVDQANLSHTFRTLMDAAGIAAPPGHRRPRLHDLRHGFATTTLLEWYRDGGDVAARIPRLTTYLGHVDPKSTYWYLTGTPQLLAQAAARLEDDLTEHDLNVNRREAP
ncbi:MAG TPA: tyrosine-type recombinase/integrase [Actinomycetales bacterium]|nr:tyrosine-type recombinase/integrase [Actinomycetales bacterium]